MINNIAAICQQVCAVAKEVGAFIKNEADKVKADDIIVKYKNNLVSYVDTTAEKMIIERLQQILPDSGFIAEENTVAPTDNDYQWIIDPLDGTTNFLRNIQSYAVSIALAYQGTIIIGVVYEINKAECFYAWKDGGAYLNEQPIQVSTTSDFTWAFLATGFPYYDFGVFDAYVEVLKVLMKETKGLRRLGAAAVDLCYVACGRFDGFFEHSLQAWDVAAASLIIQEAGGIVCDFKGGTDYIFSKEIVASNPSIYTPFFSVVNTHLGK